MAEWSDSAYMKRVLKQLLGDTILGVVDYYRFPSQRTGWRGALNGQKCRQALVEALVREAEVAAIVETGTFRGTATAYLAGLTPLPIYTVEHNPRCYGFSRAALWRFCNVHVFKGDSRDFLQRLTALSSLKGKRVLFYLDAHGGDDLPLREELETIFRHWENAIVLVDDFQVPDDPGFAYDDYGAGKALDLSYIGSLVQGFDLSVFFPSASSSDETGAKRGSVTLVAHSSLKEALRAMPEVREFQAKFQVCHQGQRHRFQ